MDPMEEPRELTELSGSIAGILYQNEENGCKTCIFDH